ncbi:hypothetical protein Taro_002610 [Colocasia esculenta]|uniref:Uncharacterized protein n=1 Tax=Colocasia esculenta TaxID=4460 RepID=A0A843TP89_COLES|nr:hypothetical protein [Colocasia esculenta]
MASINILVGCFLIVDLSRGCPLLEGRCHFPGKHRHPSGRDCPLPDSHQLGYPEMGPPLGKKPSPVRVSISLVSITARDAAPISIWHKAALVTRGPLVPVRCPLRQLTWLLRIRRHHMTLSTRSGGWWRVLFATILELGIVHRRCIVALYGSDSLVSLSTSSMKIWYGQLRGTLVQSSRFMTRPWLSWRPQRPLLVLRWTSLHPGKTTSGLIWMVADSGSPSGTTASPAYENPATNSATRRSVKRRLSSAMLRRLIHRLQLPVPHLQAEHHPLRQQYRPKARSVEGPQIGEPSLVRNKFELFNHDRETELAADTAPPYNHSSTPQLEVEKLWNIVAEQTDLQIGSEALPDPHGNLESLSPAPDEGHAIVPGDTTEDSLLEAGFAASGNQGESDFS